MELMTITKSNVLQLVNELADKRLMNDLHNGLIYPKTDESIYVENKNGDMVYSKKMQKEFDKLYDYYLTLVEETLDIYL